MYYTIFQLKSISWGQQEKFEQNVSVEYFIVFSECLNDCKLSIWNRNKVLDYKFSFSTGYRSVICIYNNYTYRLNTDSETE